MNGIFARLSRHSPISRLALVVVIGCGSSGGASPSSGGSPADTGGLSQGGASGQPPPGGFNAVTGGVTATGGLANGSSGVAGIVSIAGTATMPTAGGGGAGGSGGNSGNSVEQRLEPSANGRYLQWSDGTPIFLLSDTAWLLPARYTLEEVAAHASTRAAQGFTAIQMTASFPENGYQGLESVFAGGDFTRPVDAYWMSLDAKIKLCTDAGLIVILNPFWKKTSDATLASNGAGKSRAYGKWLGTRYRDNRRVAYFVGGDDTPGAVRDELDAMGLGIQDAYAASSLPKAIIAYHGDPAKSSREEWPANPSWLTLDWTYAYSEPLGAAMPYQENQTDWPKKPAMPIMFGEGWYDRDDGATSASRFGNRFMVRRQLWWNPLSGAVAGCAYGAEPIWLHGYKSYTPAQAVLWKSGLDAARMKKFLDGVEWWRLQPDLDRTFITAGNAAPGELDYAVGAMADDDSFGVVYLPTARNLTLKMPAGRSFTLRWFDPTNGTYRPGSVAGAAGASVELTHPGNNASNALDWVIVVES